MRINQNEYIADRQYWRILNDGIYAINKKYQKKTILIFLKSNGAN